MVNEFTAHYSFRMVKYEDYDVLLEKVQHLQKRATYSVDVAVNKIFEDGIEGDEPDERVIDITLITNNLESFEHFLDLMHNFIRNYQYDSVKIDCTRVEEC